MVIGLTGTNASGKTTIMKYFKNKHFDTFSLSDAIRDELIQRKQPLSRKNLIDVGNELREKYGASVLADRIKSKMFSQNVVIDSIRNPAEVTSLKELKDFFLVAVDAPVELRLERAKKRGRMENVETLADFIEIENKEKSQNSSHQNIEFCMEQADFKIFNTGDKKSLYNQIQDIMNKLQKNTRPSWEEYFLKMAFLVAERSTCTRHHIGAIIVKDKHVLTTGYNGAARKTDDCLKLGCLRDELGIPSGERHEICRAIHAEQNAIIQAGVHGANIEGGILYCTHTPCIICAKMIVNAGIKEVVTCSSYPDNFNLVLDLFNEANVKMRRIEQPPLKIEVLP